MGVQAECVFCRIVSGGIPARVVWSDERCLAFMDIAPLAEGHLLVIPLDHYETIDQMPSDLMAHIGSILPRLTAVVSGTTGAEGVNILQNNGTVAGQVVPHVHFHLIPRRHGDGLGYRWLVGEYPPGRAEVIFDALKREVKGVE